MSLIIPVNRLPKADNFSPRECKKCKEVKPIEAFARQQMNRRSHKCKNCTSLEGKQKREKDKIKKAEIENKLMALYLANLNKR